MYIQTRAEVEKVNGFLESAHHIEPRIILTSKAPNYVLTSVIEG